jgi:hypothetical protein
MTTVQQLGLWSVEEYAVPPADIREPVWSPDRPVTNRLFGPHNEGGPPDFAGQVAAVRAEHHRRFAELETRYNAHQIDRDEFERGIIDIFAWSGPLYHQIDRAYCAYYGIP